MTQPPPLTFSIGKISRYLLLTLVIAGSFLFSPKPKSSSDYFGQYIHLGKAAGFTFNHDAAGFCMNSRYPGQLLRDSAIRQARPLYILAGTVVGYPLQLLVDWLDLPIFQSLGEEAAMYVGFYMGYICLNFITVILSLLLFESIARYLTDNKIHRLILFSLQVALVSNEITKAFFWTAHQQFLAFFTPLLTIYWVINICSKKITQKGLTKTSIIAGVLMLVYGNFLPMFVTLLWFAYRVDKKVHLRYAIRNVLLFLAPSLLWMLVCVLKNGRYHNEEMENYRQLIWISDTLSVSVTYFFQVFLKYAIQYFSTFTDISFFIVAAICLSIYQRRSASVLVRSWLPMLWTVFAIYFLFYLMLGFYQERLTFTLFATLLCIIAGVAGNSKHFQRYPAIYIILAIAWHIYNTISYGPFS